MYRVRSAMHCARFVFDMRKLCKQGFHAINRATDAIHLVPTKTLDMRIGILLDVFIPGFHGNDCKVFLYDGFHKKACLLDLRE